MVIDPVAIGNKPPVGAPEKWDGSGAPEMSDYFTGPSTPKPKKKESKMEKRPEESGLITTTMNADQLRTVFENRVQTDRQEFTSTKRCIEKLKAILAPLQEAGIDISLGTLTYEQKSDLFPAHNKETADRASKRATFYKNIQLELHIYDRTYLVMPIDNKSFYMLSGIINKTFTTAPCPSPSDQENGSTFLFNDKDNMELFINTVFSTASVCAAAKEVTDEINTRAEPPKKAVQLDVKKPKKGM